ncbi:hypothetical protein [Micromonospora sp. KC213]|uniref:hypothetical protein n=1 Tax=Micromonospora sp. KC213 TaxID=2530378 RepID=UPI0014043086|nr:hypothetical protein [Micromonospora sp. KC213]
MTAREVLAALIHRGPAVEPEPDDIEQWVADLGRPDEAPEPQTDSTEPTQGAEQ